MSDTADRVKKIVVEHLGVGLVACAARVAGAPHGPHRSAQRLRHHRLVDAGTLALLLQSHDAALDGTVRQLGQRDGAMGAARAVGRRRAAARQQGEHEQALAESIHRPTAYETAQGGVSYQLFSGMSDDSLPFARTSAGVGHGRARPRGPGPWHAALDTPP